MAIYNVRTRRWIAGAMLAAVPAAIVVSDVLLRRPLIADYSPEALQGYVVRAALGAVTWGALVAFASSAPRAGSALIAVVAVLAVGTQIQTYARYGTYLNVRVALTGNSLWPVVGPPLLAPRVLLALAPPAIVAIGTALLRRRLVRPAAVNAAALDIAALGVAFAIFYGKPTAGWDNGAPPDVLYLSAVGALAESKWTHADVMNELLFLPATRSPSSVPKVTAPSRRNVLVILTESVRAKDIDAETTPFTDALAPRIVFRNVRALDSTTVISLGVIASGIAPTTTREELLSAPLIWEYAHAAGYRAAYLTSQNLLFANAGRWFEGLPLARFMTGTELEPYATYESGADDASIVDRALEDLRESTAPFFTVVQLANTHYPYSTDDDEAAESMPLRERYRAAILRQDRQVARLLAAARSNAITVFLSDHGEELEERDHIGHTGSVHEEQIRVPMWIDAPDGMLSSREEAALRALVDAPVTLLDVAPTLLDLLGIGDAPELAALRARMAGTSLLKGGPPRDREVVLTNCTEVFWCATHNGGVLRGTRKLMWSADEKRGAMQCYDVERDPDEAHDLGVEACAEERAAAAELRRRTLRRR